MDALRSISLPRLGWGLLLAWVFCVFYLELSPLEESLGRLPASISPVLYAAINLVPVAAAVVTLLILVFTEKPNKTISSQRALCKAVPVLAALATPFLLWHSANTYLAASLYLAAGVIAGISSGVMWVLWGIFYASLSQDNIESSTLVSAVVAALVVLGATAMNGWVAVAFIASMPFLSGIALLFAQKEPSELVPEDATAQTAGMRSPGQALRSMGRSGWGIFAACLFICVLGGLPLSENNNNFSQAHIQIVVFASLVFMLVIGLVSIAGPRRMSVSFIYRWMCPVLVCGFVAVILLNEHIASLLTFGIAIAARFAFCVITQIYFARFAAAHLASATQSYGIGWIFVHAGDLVGVVTLLVFQHITGLQDVCIAAVAIVFFVAVAMYVLGDRAAFASVLGLGGSAENSSTETTSSVVSESSQDEAIMHLAEQFALTPRETEVFNLLMHGRSVPYIRDALVVSRDTAATHVKHIYQKAGVHSRQELLDLLQKA